MKSWELFYRAYIMGDLLNDVIDTERAKNVRAIFKHVLGIETIENRLDSHDKWIHDLNDEFLKRIQMSEIKVHNSIIELKNQESEINKSIFNIHNLPGTVNDKFEKRLEKLESKGMRYDSNSDRLEVIEKKLNLGSYKIENKNEFPEFDDNDDKYTILQQTVIELQCTLELKKSVIRDLKREINDDLEVLYDKRPFLVKKEDIEKFVHEVHELRDKWRERGT